MALPAWLAGLFYRLGDLAGGLGWRPPVRSTAQREIARGAVGDPSAWIRPTGIAPRSIETMLDARPASVQEGWFAALYLLKPLVPASLAIFWAGSGLAFLEPGYAPSITMMQQGGTAAVAPLAVLGGGLADLVVGLGTAIRGTARLALLLGIAVALLYAAPAASSCAGYRSTPWRRC